MNRGISNDGTYKQAVEVVRIDVAILAEELTEIYSTPTPKRWPEQKKQMPCILDLLLFFTIAGVWYLYPESKYESYTSMIHYNFLHKRKHS